MSKSKLVTMAGDEKIELSKGVYTTPKTAAIMANYFKRKAAEAGKPISSEEAIERLKKFSDTAQTEEQKIAIGGRSPIHSQIVGQRGILIASAVGLSLFVILLKRADKKKGRKK